MSHDGVVLNVKPSLKPTEKLEFELLSARLTQLANQESDKGLIDQGGLMPTNREQVLKSSRRGL